MRVNVYAEEMTDRIEIISKEIDGHTFTGLRLYLYMPVSFRTQVDAPGPRPVEINTLGDAETPHGELQGPFIHRDGDDDSSAVTFWGKRDLRDVLRKALALLDQHYERTTNATHSNRS